MRGHLKKGVNVTEDEKDPQLLASRNFDAFSTVRAYERALEDGNIRLVGRLREANRKLFPYFKFADRAWNKKSANAKAARRLDTV